ncbi:thermonuclease family protein [Methylomonas sp. EFPC3]|uniref:thermonuclease family protein n=1 Tax=Methylomonas sp. EFPC3 TaxID=3021710 RepID=UPI002417EBE0|nr:thermonuclease family protein [Methylomonas sp. EFPC3]WFP51405.1 thermonuclease family protein [Methylomonas sp. EFPC3]
MKKLFPLLILTPLLAFANEWTGTVVGISDGDTLTVLNAQKKQIKIRLAEIDAPESKQAFGTQAKQSLSELCFKKSAVVEDKGTDKYKRTIGRIKCNGVDANAEQVKRGFAWAYRQYLTDQNIAALEESAKAAGVGLWADAEPTPPWEFRHGGKPKKAAPTAKADDDLPGFGDGGNCGAKRTCGQMNSCAEAKHYLNDCGLSRLDRDHDGIPCESICR